MAICFWGFFLFVNSVDSQIDSSVSVWMQQTLLWSGSADRLAEERWPCITVRMSCPLIPSVFNNLIPVSPASLYQRNRPPVSLSVGRQFIFLLVESCEVWLAEEARLGGSLITPPGLLSTDEESIRSTRLTNGSQLLAVEEKKETVNPSKPPYFHFGLWSDISDLLIYPEKKLNPNWNKLEEFISFSCCVVHFPAVLSLSCFRFRLRHLLGCHKGR